MTKVHQITLSTILRPFTNSIYAATYHGRVLHNSRGLKFHEPRIKIYSHGALTKAVDLEFSFHTIVSNDRMKRSANTKSRILDVAEELFGEQGLDRVSVRDITKRAKVNLAAIGYHFGSREDLIAAVFERRVVPVNEARLAAIDAVEQSAGKKGPELEAILAAFIRPAVHGSLGAHKGETAFSKLFGRCLSEPSPYVEALLKKQFAPLVKRMDAALQKALPGLSRSEIFWRMKFTYGALHHWLLTKDKFRPDWVEDVNLEAQTQKLISFAAAGFRAA